jgi:hypothetical protein
MAVTTYNGMKRRESREFLCTQRRLCIDRGFHTFSLRFNGKIDADQAFQFFSACPELDFIINSDGKNSWQICLNRK